MFKTSSFIFKYYYILFNKSSLFFHPVRGHRKRSSLHSFWFCNQNPSCNFFCSEDESYLCEKAAAAWKSTKQSHPRCEKNGKLGKMRLVKNLLKPSYGRPFFVCSDQSNPCSFWVWSDVQPIAKPECRHGFPCVIRKVKKEGVNKDRLFFCCAQEIHANTSNGCPPPHEPNPDARFFRPIIKAKMKSTKSAELYLHPPKPFYQRSR